MAEYQMNGAGKSLSQHTLSLYLGLSISRSSLPFYCILFVALWCVIVHAYFMVNTYQPIFCVANAISKIANVNHSIVIPRQTEREGRESKQKGTPTKYSFDCERERERIEKSKAKKRQPYVNTECHTLNYFSFIHCRSLSLSLSNIESSACVFFSLAFFNTFYLYTYRWVLCMGCTISYM